MPYINALCCASIPSLVDRREQLSRKFFTSILQPSSCLHTILPTPGDPTITTRLRSANKFPRLPSRTRKYQTFISYALAHYHVVDVFVLYVFVFFIVLPYCAIWSYDHKLE